MTAFRSTVLAAALLLAGLTGCAQTEQDHALHHPESAPAAQAPAVAPGDASPQGGMTGAGMTGSGTTGAEGMMGGRAMMPGMMGMMGARPIEHLEGRLAFIRTELKITDAQTAQWNAFADTVRANARSMTEMHRSMMSGQAAPKTLPERLAFQRNAMTAHLDALNKTTAALDKLYAALSADQKKAADAIIVGPMGMPMGMM